MSATTRSAVKCNSTRRLVIRASLVGLPCFTCGHAVKWQHADDKSVSPWTANLGHVIAAGSFATGGGYVAGNIGAQCWTCNTDAKVQGKDDLTAYVIRGSVPSRWLTASDMRDLGDGADVRGGRFTTRQQTSATARRASRFALWGW